MSDGALTVLDGTHLRAVDLSLPEADVSSLTGAQVLDLADSKASSSLFGLSLPQGLKSSALKRVNVQDDGVFRRAELDREQALKLTKDYITAIADELKGIDLLHSHIKFDLHYMVWSKTEHFKKLRRLLSLIADELRSMNVYVLRIWHVSYDIWYVGIMMNYN